MAIIKRASSQALVLTGLMLAGCAMEGGDGLFTTGSLTGSANQAAAESKTDPVCITLASRIETLRKEGVQDKIEKAAAKRYKMTQADLGKADQLNKANAEFQARCSTVTPRPTTAEAAPAASAPAAAPKKTAKAAPTKAP
jgi:DNA-binding PucR family transcriptional regulator